MEAGVSLHRRRVPLWNSFRHGLDVCDPTAASTSVQPPPINGHNGMVLYGMVEVCEGAPVAVSGWVLTDRHDLAPCAANSLHRETVSVNNVIGGTGTLGNSVGT